MGSRQTDTRTTLSEAVDDAQAILLLTRWPEFKNLPVLLSNRSEPPIVIDGRRLLDPASVARYEGIGFRASQPKDVPFTRHMTPATSKCSSLLSVLCSAFEPAEVLMCNMYGLFAIL